MKRTVNSIFIGLLSCASVCFSLNSSPTRVISEDSVAVKMTYLNDMGLSFSNDYCGLYSKIPAIGVYNTEEYSFRNNRCIIRMKNNMLSHAPDKLISDVKDYIGKKEDTRSIDQVLDDSSVSCDFYTVVTGVVEDKEKDSKDRSYNILYHGFLLQDQPANTTKFQGNVAMGVFGGNGIVPASSDTISFDSLKEELVLFHDFVYCCPNNARFTVLEDRKLSDFWCAGVSTDKKRVVVTYYLLVNDPKLVDNIEQIFTVNDDLDKILEKLTQLAESEDLTSQDKISLLEFVTYLQIMSEADNLDEA